MLTSKPSKVAKVVICGMKSVGKTAILEQLIYGSITPDSVSLGNIFYNNIVLFYHLKPADIYLIGDYSRFCEFPWLYHAFLIKWSCNHTNKFLFFPKSLTNFWFLTSQKNQFWFQCIFFTQEIHSTIEDTYVASVDTGRGSRDILRIYDTAGLQGTVQVLLFSLLNNWNE